MLNTVAPMRAARMSEQDEVIDFLCKPHSHGGPAGAIERIDTHGSLIVLRGDQAYKLKRAVAYASLDFRTLQSRARACQAELTLNRRTAPNFYLGVSAITRQADGTLAFDGTGTVLDWVVVMRRFPQKALFERMASAGTLTLELAQRLGAEIAHFHNGAERTPAHGGADGIQLAIEENHRELLGHPDLLPLAQVQSLHRASLRVLDQQADTLEQRRHSGRVRRCHGDLRLANICLFEGRPTLFDGIEFSERLNCIDVLYDLAFVLMDLRFRHLPQQAEQLLARYRAQRDDEEDCQPLPLFFALRAALRAFTLAGSAKRQTDPGMARLKARQSRSLLRLARASLEFPASRLTLGRQRRC